MLTVLVLGNVLGLGVHDVLVPESVLLTSHVFALSHTRYLEADAMLLLFMATLVFSSICWTYMARRTGSVTPIMVAHAFTNGVATLILFDVWAPFLVLSVTAIVLRAPILRTTAEFVGDWRNPSRCWDDCRRWRVWARC